MRTRRLALGLVPPVALVVLVVVLAALQYRWLGQVSEAERVQLRESLERRAHEFGEDFDRELAHAFRVFQTGMAGLDAGEAARLAARHDDWQATARFPSMLAAIYFLQATGDERHLFRYQPDMRTLEPAAWPPALARMRHAGRP